MKNLLSIAFFGAALICAPVRPAAADEPQWIWNSPDATQQAVGTCYFRYSFTVEQPESAKLELTGDNGYELFVNGRRLGSGSQWNQLDRYDIGPNLVSGRNVIAVKAVNADGPAGLVARGTIERQGKPALQFASDATWKTHSEWVAGWRKPDLDDSAWKAAVVLGPLGKTAPWGTGVAAGKSVAAQPSVAVAAPAKFDLVDGDRVVLLGGTFFEREQGYGYLEAGLISRFSGKKITIRNLGWSGDTVWGEARAGFGTPADGFREMEKQVKAAEPTVIVVAYGNNEAFAGAAGIEQFAEGLEDLLQMLSGTQARIVLFSCLQHENLGPPLPNPEKYNRDARLYSGVIEEAARERGLLYVNLLEVVCHPDTPAVLRVTDNGVHLTPFGYWRIAPKILAAMGLPEKRWLIDIDNGKLLEASRATVTDIERLPNGWRFRVKDEFLPEAKAPAGTPELALVNRAGNRTLRFRGLNGNIRLRIDRRDVDTMTGDDWGQGVVAITSPDNDQADRLRRQIVAKNELYFHRYRPENETYLFGFRKHEQGNNAVEIPQFDPLIASKDARIRELAIPLEHVYELIEP